MAWLDASRATFKSLRTPQKEGGITSLLMEGEKQATTLNFPESIYFNWHESKIRRPPFFSPFILSPPHLPSAGMKWESASSWELRFCSQHQILFKKNLFPVEFHAWGTKVPLTVCQDLHLFYISRTKGKVLLFAPACD